MSFCFFKKSKFLVYIILFLSFNFSGFHDISMGAQEDFLNKCATYIVNQKEELKTLVENIFLKLKESLQNEKDSNIKVKIMSDAITDLLLIIEESFQEFSFPKNLLEPINSKNLPDYLKYVTDCQEVFDENLKIIEKKKIDHVDFLEKSQNITLTAQILTSTFQELLSILNSEIKIDTLKSFIGKFNKNYNAKIKEEYTKKILKLAKIISFHINSLQEVITYINLFDHTNSEIFAKRKEFLKECFDSVIKSFSFIESLYEKNFSLNEALKLSEKIKNKLLIKLKSMVEEKDNDNSDKNDLTKPLVILTQDFVKEKKDYFLPVFKNLYQNVYGKISNFKNLTPTGKFLSTILDVKQVLFGFVIACVYKHLCIKTKNDLNILKKIIENRLLVELYNVKLSDNASIKNIFKISDSDKDNFKWFTDNCSEMAVDLAYIYNNPLEFDKKMTNFYDKYGEERIKKIDDSCFEIKKMFDKEDGNDIRKKIINLSNKGDVVRYDVIYQNIISGVGSSLDVGLNDFLKNDLNTFSKSKPGIVPNFFTKFGSVTSSLLGLVGTMAKNCLMGGGFVTLDKIYEESFIEVVGNFNGKVSEVFSVSNGPNGEKIDLTSRTPNFNINRSVGEMNKRNIGLSTDKAVVEQLKRSTGISYKLAAFLTSLIEVSGSFWAIFKFEESVKIFKIVEEAFSKFHNYMIDKEAKSNDFSSKKENFSDYTLDSSVFDNLRQKGALSWFYDVIEGIKNPHIPSNKNLSRSVLISGPSGSGKTFLTKAFAQTVLNVGGSVRFMSIDPKDLFLKDEKDKKEGDIIQNISQYIESGMSSIGNETFIIHLDEFHLFFSTETGGLNHSRIADFLKLFNDLNEKQKKNPGTGFYIIVSTNKANLVPVEFFQNPSRIGAVVYIDYPDINERKALIKSYLKKLGIPSNQIDIDLISSVLEGKKVSQGRLMKIVQSAISKSKITKTLISTEMILSSIDQVSKGIIYDIKGLEQKTIDNLCDYYSSISTLGLCFSNESEIVFDSATIYPVVKQIKPEHIDNMYKIAKDQELFYGKAFFNEVDSRVKFISLSKTLEEILFFIAGGDYCLLNNIRSPMSSSLDDYRDAYSSAINYIAFSDTSKFSKEFECFAFLDMHGTEEYKENPYAKSLEDVNVKKKAKEILRICSLRLKEFISKSEAFKAVQKEVNLTLRKQKIVRKNSLEENKIIKEQIKNLRSDFKEFFETLKLEIEKTSF